MNNSIDSASRRANSSLNCSENKSEDKVAFTDQTDCYPQNNHGPHGNPANTSGLTRLKSRIVSARSSIRDMMLCFLRESLNKASEHVPPTCTLYSARLVLSILSPLAAKLLTHYQHGRGEPVSICTSLVVEDNLACKKLLAKSCLKNGVVTNLSGHVILPQKFQTSLGNRLSFGSLRLNWYLDNTDLVVNFIKWYEWSPKEDRISQAIHRAAYRAQQSGRAMPFRVLGKPFALPIKDLLALTAFDCARDIEPEGKTLHLL